MGLKACALCYYQRTFVMGVAGVMLMGLLAGARPAGLTSLLSLPLAVGALGVALWHEYLEINGKLECPAGILGLGTAPQQSLAVMVVLLVFLGADVLLNRPARRLGLSLVGVLVLGGLLAFGCVKSAAPAAKPTAAYPAPPDICRPPFTGVPNP
jgi:disulfide bond formation protein DsbB